MDEETLMRIEADWVRDGQKLYDQDAIELIRLAKIGALLLAPAEHETSQDPRCGAI